MSRCTVTLDRYCIHDRCWKEWFKELQEEVPIMTMEELTRLLDRLVDKVKLLETELEVQENRVYELECKTRTLEDIVDEIESSIDWTPPNG